MAMEVGSVLQTSECVVASEMGERGTYRSLAARQSMPPLSSISNERFPDGVDRA